jgi:AcrR family transcriptional regulator
MPGPAERPGRANKPVRRLVDAAAEIFARDGYQGARVRDIVKLAGTNLAAVNYYFGGKEKLYAVTLSELAAAQVVERPRAIPGEDPEEALLRGVRSTIHRMLEVTDRSPVGRIIAHESLKPTPYLESLVNEIVRPQVEYFSGLMMRIAGGRLTDQQADAAAGCILGQCLFHLFGRSAIQRVDPCLLDGDPVDALARHITTFTMGGIGALLAADASPRNHQLRPASGTHARPG